jgi:endogenous inhibitor of DNA gyrase (YacG/DUF329 family)
MAMAVRCPKCGTTYEDENIPDVPFLCPNCGASLIDAIAAAKSGLAAASTSESGSTSRSTVVSRYRDAYRVSGALIALGNTIKILGAGAAAIIVVGVASLDRGLVVGGLVVGAIAGVLLWVGGVVVASQGQILRATLDNAVASSHFLTHHERAAAMGIPASIADKFSASSP